MLQGVLYILVFLAGVVVFAKVPTRTVRQISLLAGSYLLYLTWQPWFAAVLLGSTLLNYGMGLWLSRKPTATVLWLGILLNLGFLGSFKYLPEVAVSLPFSSLQSFAHLALPLGISFWTFQGMSYLFDLYREEEIDPSLVEFALYMAFFPVTISGPVCRMPDMLPQFRSERLVSGKERERGFERIAIGVLMMQVARLLGHGILAGDGINSGFDRLAHWSGPDVWCLAFGYGLQLFFDFAGYSHIAIGAAQALGFVVPENFACPFASTSPSVFWTRWHMSLSFWIRDYIFLPLATAFRPIWWRNVALVISMVIFGLWHKATLLFVIWGCYHGVLLVLHRQVQRLERAADWRPPERLWSIVSWAVTISFISLGWIFFRANSVGEAGSMFSALVSPGSYGRHYLSFSLYWMVLLLAVSYGFVLIVAGAFASQSDAVVSGSSFGIMSLLERKRWYWVPPLYALALIAMLMITLTQGASTAQFMYRAF